MDKEDINNNNTKSSTIDDKFTYTTEITTEIH